MGYANFIPIKLQEVAAVDYAIRTLALRQKHSSRPPRGMISCLVDRQGEASRHYWQRALVD